MAVDLDARQRKALREALIDAFPSWGDLAIMVSDQLDERLGVVTAQSNDLEQVAFDLIEWVRARGRVGDLVVGARNANPGNPRLFGVASRIGLTASAAPTSVLEKLVGGNTTFLDVARWRTELTRAEWRVCRIDRDGAGCGTGFLVGPDAVLTNYHVVEPAIDGGASPDRYTCRFDYKVSEAGDVISAGEVVPLASDGAWLIDASPYSAVDTVPDPKPGDPAADELDYALLRLARREGDRAAGGRDGGEARSWLVLEAAPVDYRALSAVAILQHPETLPLKLALGMDERVATNDAGNRIRYSVPTLPDSSGSPVFDSDWRLIGLHHSGDPRRIRPEFNEGIPIAAIATRPGVAAYLDTLAEEEEEM